VRGLLADAAAGASKQVRRVVQWRVAEKLYEAASASLRRVEEECSAESARVLRGPRPARRCFPLRSCNNSALGLVSTW
jgi:hypothetical protein